MAGHIASPRPLPFQSHYDPQVHVGQVTFTGSTTVNLGLNHNNFTVAPCIRGGIADLAPAHIIAWAYHPTIKGAFVITAGKATAAGTTTVILATASLTVSFVAYAEASVPQ